MVVAKTPAIGAPVTSKVEASVNVDEAVKLYVGAWSRTARCVAKAPAANCTVRARFRFTSFFSAPAGRDV